MPQFDHEKLDAYGLQLEFIGWAADLFDELHEVKGRRIAETLDQLDRASLSVLLNMAEGNGRRASQQRVRFFDDARGSAAECAACLDALVAKRASSDRRVIEGKALLFRVVSILSKLIERFSRGAISASRVREDEGEEGVNEDEYKYEDEDDSPGHG